MTKEEIKKSIEDIAYHLNAVKGIVNAFRTERDKRVRTSSELSPIILEANVMLGCSETRCDIHVSGIEKMADVLGELDKNYSSCIKRNVLSTTINDVYVFGYEEKREECLQEKTA